VFFLLNKQQENTTKWREEIRRRVKEVRCDGKAFLSLLSYTNLLNKSLKVDLNFIDFEP